LAHKSINNRFIEPNKIQYKNRFTSKEEGALTRNGANPKTEIDIGGSSLFKNKF
jgi:hypothetical protein